MANGIDWFRWHHGSVTDPKFALIAKKSGARLGDVLAVWAYVLERASASDERGTFGEIDCEAVDCMLGMNDGQCASIYAAMSWRGLVSDGKVCAWEKRQPKRERPEDNSSERVRRYKQRVKENGGEVGGYLRHHAYVMKRDDGKCVYCGTTDGLCLDHMIPVVQGGDDEPDNLAAACKACNSGKSGRTPEEARYSIRSDGALRDYEKAKSRHLERSHAKSRQVTPREEKRREEEIHNPPTPDGVAPPKRAKQVDCPEDVDCQVWADWLSLRKAKKAPVTETVISSAKGEAIKAGLTLTEFLRVWCARGSQGLQAEWLKPEDRNRGSPMTAAERRVLQAVPSLAAPHLRPQQPFEVFDVDAKQVG